ncbi:probable flavin-containing monooxygenase 1 isoform X2 [Ziziphus jujuba]|uniref:Flavin-containing monooxygenase n=1 Tax=Ziziphus jujuba TaxID=326968 RepID=A0A6P6GA55_ZIZJJ|nr:probable flavin-containing monooxygenase 1 isoform X2 [Ziziphus jujuba]
MEKRKIAIIGAGISGLVACRHTMEKGFSPIVLEAKSGIGGVWSKTIESTKLQTPKSFFQFSDFAWPPSVTETFPDHNQSEEDMVSWDLWDGSGEPFSPSGKWNITLQDAGDPCAPTEVYQVDFVILCTGRYSDLPNMPAFPMDRGPHVFDGVVMHSMDYAAMEDDHAAEFIKGKLVTVVGFQKSAVDLAAQVAKTNGPSKPCTLLFRTAHYTVPDHLVTRIFQSLNRFAEFMVHKPSEGFFVWLLAFVLSPLLWLFSKLVEIYLRLLYPLKKYNMVPIHSFLDQISPCKFMAEPANFYDRVKQGSLIPKKSRSFCFCKNGLILDDEATPLATDIVIFATGYKSDEKLKNIFASTYFQQCIIGSSAPFYRECIHPLIPNLAILGYAETGSNLFSTETRSKWVAHFLAGNFKLPTIREMEDDVNNWKNCMQRFAGMNYRRHCVSVLLQIYFNDLLCKDMGFKPRRKNWFLAELFAPYIPMDYKKL